MMAGDNVGVRRPAEAARPDDELVQRFLAGERAAFDALVERYQKRAVSVSYRLLGNLHDALEVVQDAFVKAYRSAETIEDATRFGPWLLRIVTNLSLNFRRDRAVGGPRISLSDCIVDDDQPAAQARLSDSSASSDRPGADLAATELSERVQEALNELPSQQRAALVLFSVEALPQRDVATILGCSVEAVKWHVFQARRKLRERLAEHL